MSVTTAQTAAGQLRVALLDHGVRAVSIELQPGVGPKANPWHCQTFKRGLGHHIASRPSQGITPGLALVKRGRSDLQGPLCNGYGGYDLVARIITMGWANHPGAGGPWTVPGWGTIPRDNGRPYLFGWEFEGGYEPYTDAMHDFMARCAAGTLEWLGGAPLDCWGEHKDPWAPGRKIDRLGYTAASGRARIQATQGDDPMTPEDRAWLNQRMNDLAAYVRDRGVDGQRHTTISRDELAVTIQGKLAALTEVVEQLGRGQGTAIDMAAVEAVVEKGVADAIAAIETTVRVQAPAP